MPEFSCRVGTPAGDVRVETHVARDEETLRGDLVRRNLHVFDIRQRGAGIRVGNIRIGVGLQRVPRRQFLLFNQQMVALIRAGLPLLQALDVILERMKPGPFQRYLSDIRGRVQSGSALSEAFAAQGEAFPRVYGAALTAGERSGELATVMARYLQFAKKTEHIRTKVTAALIYPLLLSIMSCALVGILMFYVLPKFSEFYGEFDADLPAITEIVIGTAQWLQSQWMILAGVVVGSAVALRAWYQTDKGRLALDGFLLRLPLLGEVVRMYNIAQFSRTLSTLLAGGIPLLPSLQTTAGAVANRVFAVATAVIAEDVRQGRPLWESIERTSTMTDMTIELVKVGESTGSLDVMLTNVAEFYDEQVDEAMTRVVSLFEPVLLIVMGIVVAFLLLSMYLPIFKLAGASGEGY
jgi:type IV pilus assembly protein PilC